MASTPPVKTSALSGSASAGQAELSAFESEVIVVFVDMMQLIGLPKSYGEIYGLLYSSAAPLSFARIEQKLTLSKGSISQGLRALRELGAVKAEAAPVGLGARELFSAQVEMRRLVSVLLQERLVPYLRNGVQRIAAIEAALTDADAAARPPEELEVLQSRAEKLRIWQQRSSTVLPLIAKLLG